MRLGVFSDVHGHIGAMEVAISHLQALGAEKLVFLGDAVGYVPSLDAVRLLQASDIVALCGNHEALLRSRAWDAEQDSICRFSAIETLLADKDRQWLQSLPSRYELVCGGRRLLFVHGSPTDPLGGYVYPQTDLEPFAETDASVVFMGNTHVPFVRRCGAVKFVNVGSCGLPRGNDARGSACLYDCASGNAALISFPIAASARRVLRQYELHPAVAGHLRRCAEASPRTDD